MYKTAYCTSLVCARVLLLVSERGRRTLLAQGQIRATADPASQPPGTTRMLARCSTLLSQERRRTHYFLGQNLVSVQHFPIFLTLTSLESAESKREREVDIEEKKN